eukprot:GHVS01082556.1.p1 GENE.GHVS01082556.1~~GHVS01082556.1.p1  ORF type:complete len:236 (+),score=21.27 GHVS01082556.1:540-1247(+)
MYRSELSVRLVWRMQREQISRYIEEKRQYWTNCVEYSVNERSVLDDVVSKLNEQTWTKSCDEAGPVSLGLKPHGLLAICCIIEGDNAESVHKDVMAFEFPNLIVSNEGRNQFYLTAHDDEWRQKFGFAKIKLDLRTTNYVNVDRIIQTVLEKGGATLKSLLIALLTGHVKKPYFPYIPLAVFCFCHNQLNGRLQTDVRQTANSSYVRKCNGGGYGVGIEDYSELFIENRLELRKR